MLSEKNPCEKPEVSNWAKSIDLEPVCPTDEAAILDAPIVLKISCSTNVPICDDGMLSNHLSANSKDRRKNYPEATC